VAPQLHHPGRRSEPDGLECPGGKGAEVGADAEASAVEADGDGLNLPEVVHQMRPGSLDSLHFSLPLQVHLQPQSQKRGHDVTDGGVVPMVLNGPDL